MQTPPRVRFQGMDASAALEARVREEIDALAHRHPEILRCDVIVLSPHHHHRHGRIYTVHIDLTLPGVELAVNREPGRNHAREDPFVAVRDAFDAARRRVLKELDRHRSHGDMAVR